MVVILPFLCFLWSQKSPEHTPQKRLRYLCRMLSDFVGVFWPHFRTQKQTKNDSLPYKILQTNFKEVWAILGVCIWGGGGHQKKTKWPKHYKIMFFVGFGSSWGFSCVRKCGQKNTFRILQNPTKLLPLICNDYVFCSVLWSGGGPCQLLSFWGILGAIFV